MSTSKATYHHGDLRAACVRAAIELLEESGETELSLRAVARRAGRVAGRPLPTLRRPRSARLSRRGGRLPRARRAAGGSAPIAVDPGPARQRGGRLRAVRARATRPVPNHVRRAVRPRQRRARRRDRSRVALRSRDRRARSSPDADAEALATAIWALVHGLAFLHLDGKLARPTPSAVAERVTAAIHALLAATNFGPDTQASAKG